MNKATRFDMLTELATEQVNDVRQCHNYEELHAWLQPLFFDKLKETWAESDDQTLADWYKDHLGTSPQGYEEEEEQE